MASNFERPQRSLFFILLIFHLAKTSLQSGCVYNSDCGDAKSSLCLSGSCTGCSSDAQCATAIPSMPFCKISGFSSLCQPTCSTNADCTSVWSSSCISGECSQARSTADCAHFGSGYVIDPYNMGLCEAPCSTNNDCTNPLMSVCSSGQCSYCTVDSGCTHLSQTPYCGTQNCIQCTTNTQCAAGQICNNGLCVQSCTSNSQCTSVTASLCGLSTFCTKCGTDSDCSHINGMNACSSGSCVVCASNSQCTSPTASRCSNTNTCAACTTDSDCSQITGQNLCSSGSCVACTSNSQCTSPTASRCANTNTCAACTTDSDCSQITGKNVCSGGTCTACHSGFKLQGQSCVSDTPTPAPKTTISSSRLSTGGIIGVCIGSVAAASASVLLVRYFLVKYRRNQISSVDNVKNKRNPVQTVTHQNEVVEEPIQGAIQEPIQEPIQENSERASGSGASGYRLNVS